MEFQLSYFQILKDDAVEGLHSIWQQIWKIWQWPQDWKVSFHPNLKECSIYCTVALISHTSKAMLKILQARLQQYMNWEHPDVQSQFRKGQRNQRSNCQHPLDQRKSRGVPEKHLLLFYWLHQSLWLCRSQQTGKFFKICEYQTTLPVSWEICMQVKKQQLELDME